MRRIEGATISVAMVIWLGVATTAAAASERPRAGPDHSGMPVSFARAAAESSAAVITLRVSARGASGIRGDD